MVLIVAAVLSVTSFMTPLNYRQVTINSQIKILEKLWPKGKKLLELKDKDRAAEAYDYVAYSLEAADYLPEYLRGNPAKTEVENYQCDKYDEDGNIAKDIRFFCDNYEKVILTMDKGLYNSIDGIKILNIIDWLLD